jgi:hypothetical protein
LRVPSAAPWSIAAYKGEGGQFLLVPPHYDGPPLPGGYTPQPRPPELVAGRDQIVYVV